MRIKVLPKDADRGAGPAKARTTPITSSNPSYEVEMHASSHDGQHATLGRHTNYFTDRSVICQGVIDGRWAA